jgi:diguanylate cyclase (GGDEF)-like protein
LIAIDVDGTAQINQQKGTALSDQLLREIGILLRDGLRQERGFDVPARISGQRFGALLGFATPRQASHALERIRQIIEATVFEASDGPCQVRVSCAATALQKQVSLSKHLEWLTLTLEFAKERGGNCLAVWHDGEATQVEPIDYEIEPRTVKLDAPAKSPASANDDDWNAAQSAESFVPAGMALDEEATERQEAADDPNRSSETNQETSVLDKVAELQEDLEESLERVAAENTSAAEDENSANDLDSPELADGQLGDQSQSTESAEDLIAAHESTDSASTDNQLESATPSA